MTQEKIVFAKNFQFAVKFEWEDDPTYLNFKVVEAIAEFDLEAKKEAFSGYQNSSGQAIDDFEEAYGSNPVCNGFIKWDGCMEIHDFTHHFCGYNTFAQDIIELIYRSAKHIMGDTMNDECAALSNLPRTTSSVSYMGKMAHELSYNELIEALECAANDLASYRKEIDAANESKISLMEDMVKLRLGK